jgi:tetratricopeptide (TPR) repeat protein
VTGWIADFFLFWWALVYWNIRKTWFRLTGAHRDACPCQNYSDSGHALDSRCSAITYWRKPARFRRVCPLLTETKDGWRCGVDAERVRPFWGRAAFHIAVAALVLYAAGTAAVFATLRSAGYEISYLAVAWPSRWPELRASQERLYATRAQQALAAGRYAEAMLALQRVCELNPQNYSAALTLANLCQVSGQPYVAGHIYERLMHDVPEHRATTARIWIRTLLARADYAQLKPLAVTMLSEDSDHREAWLHALLFACRQTKDVATLKTLLDSHTGLPDWCLDLAQTELLLLRQESDRAMPRLLRVQSRPGSSYVPYYQADRLLALGRHAEAGDLISAYGPVLPLEEAAFLRLHLYRAQGWKSLAAAEYDSLLSLPVTPRLAAQFFAWLVQAPDASAFGHFADRFLARGPALTNETLDLYHAGYLAAVLCGDGTRAARFNDLIMRFTGSNARALNTLGEALARGPGRPPLLPQLLPLVPLPIEVTYAILGRGGPAPNP